MTETIKDYGKSSKKLNLKDVDIKKNTSKIELA